MQRRLLAHSKRLYNHLEMAAGFHTLKLCLLMLIGSIGAALWGQQPAVAGVDFSHLPGFYEAPVTVSLSAPESARIYYTLDGDKPTLRSQRYTRPFLLKKTAVVRAVALYPDGSMSRPVAHTFFVNEPESTLPVVSIGAPPGLLFDPDIGLFMTGNSIDTGSMMQAGANFWSRRELVAHVEIFESDGSNVFSSQVGARLFGGMSRLFPQKSLALVARERYGEKRFYYPIFGDAGPKSCKFLVLRNAGSDFGRAHFRDALMTGLLDGWDLEKQAYRPAHVYINGQYWGIYNIREKINRYFIADHHDVDKDSIDLLEHRYNLRRGSKNHYLRLLRFLQSRNLAEPANYAWVQSQMDVDNFMNYQIAQIYFDNQDAGGNIKFWRPQTPTGRWRWILYDTDWGFGLHDAKAWRNNSLAFHTEPDGPHWPNPPWSTFILRKLLENPDFRQAFTARFCDHLNTTFRSERVAAAIEEKYRVLRPEMPRHLQRWRLSRAKWEREVQIMRDFAAYRPEYVFQHLSAYFQTGPLRELHAAASPGGALLLNDHIEVTAAGGDFSGQYFERQALQFKAVAMPGYRFVRWEGAAAAMPRREITLPMPPAGLQLRAVFEPYRHPLADKIIINEVCPFNGQTGDWIELHNITQERVRLDGWIVTDARNEAVLPAAVIGPKDYLILCRDEARFRQVFPQAHNVMGGLSFGLHKREDRIGVYSADGALIDEIQYALHPTDSVFTLALLMPHLDNSDPQNWQQKQGMGTPAGANPFFVQSRISKMQRAYLEMGIAAGMLVVGLMLLWWRHKGVF